MNTYRSSPGGLRRTEPNNRPAASSDLEQIQPLPSVAGCMEMTHEDFQRACQVELGRFQEDQNCDNAIVHLLCEAIRCSRECCALAQLALRVKE